MRRDKDPVIDTLLDLHGSILDQGGGYWINDFFADVDRALLEEKP